MNPAELARIAAENEAAEAAATASENEAAGEPEIEAAADTAASD